MLDKLTQTSDYSSHSEMALKRVIMTTCVFMQLQSPWWCY